MVAAANHEGVRLFVYALCEPDGKTIRYIGLSANLYKRLKSHVLHSGSPSVRAWINSLRIRGLIPSLIVLREVVGIEAGAAAEKEEIQKHKAILGESLFNEQQTGKRTRQYREGTITFAGKSLTLADWARELGISRQALNTRLNSHPVEVALSRPKGSHVPLSPERLSPEWPSDGSETIVLDERAIDPLTFGVLDCERVKTGLNQDQRRVRRNKMAAMAQAGASTGWIASYFNCTTATVQKAIKEFNSGELEAVGS